MSIIITLLFIIIAVQTLFALRVWYYRWEHRFRPIVESCEGDIWLVASLWWDIVHLHMFFWLTKRYPRIYWEWLKRQSPWIFLTHYAWWYPRPTKSH